MLSYLSSFLPSSSRKRLRVEVADEDEEEEEEGKDSLARVHRESRRVESAGTRSPWKSKSRERF